MRKMSFILGLIAVLMIIPAFAVLDADTDNVNITLQFPTDKTYNTATGVKEIILVANVSWNGASAAAAGMNITNGTFVFRSPTGVETYFINNTINGSRTSIISGNFTVNVSGFNFSEIAYTVHFVAWNESTAGYQDDNTINSSKVTFTFDRSNPSAVISTPLVSSTVVPNNNIVTFEYTQTDTNAANCSLHLNDQLVKSSTSGTTTANATSGILQRFTQSFGADNSSVRVAIDCLDLAGLRTTSSQLNNFTFSVVLGSISPAQRQQLYSGGGGGYIQQPSQPAFSGVSQSAAVQQASTHLQKWAWAYVISIAAAGLYAFRKKFK